MKFCLIFLFVFTSLNASAQADRYFVKLKHKGAANYPLSDPWHYLSRRSIERRQRQQIAIDSLDLPIPRSYIEQIQAIPDVTILNQSRWLNTVAVYSTNPTSLQTLRALHFVASVETIAGRTGVGRKKMEDEYHPLPPVSARHQQTQEDYFNYGAGSLAEISLHNGQFLHNIGLRGQGMEIAMLDGGFRNYNTLPAFDSVVKNNQVLSTWDFVDRHSTVIEDHQHGMQCFSTIAANIPGVFTGKAPKAFFHLFRTEDVSSEYPIEEFNWVCGAERADSIGADIVSSSLGYGYDWDGGIPDYPYSDLNGDKTIAARGADIAASRGLLVFNSAGNAGNDPWKMITTPADADSVVAVGAVNNNGLVGTFSSYGPSADGRIKPDVASVGVAAMIQGTGGNVVTSNGTSYAGPNMAGLATCLWQGFPEVNNMRIVQVLKESASQYNTPDDRIGYGIPDMKKAYATLLKEFTRSNITQLNCRANIRWITKDAAGMKTIIERKKSNENTFTPVAELRTDRTLAHGTYQYDYSLPLDDAGTQEVQFRIVQVIDSASATYTAVILDTLSIIPNACPQIEKFSFRVIGQPLRAGHYVGLAFESPESKTNLGIVVYTSNGQRVHSTSIPGVVKGSSFSGINFTSTTPGVYYVVVYEGNKILAHATYLQL